MGRHNLRTVISFEVVRTLSKPRFWIAILAVPILLVFVALLVTVSSSGSDASAEKQTSSRFTFGYTDASHLISPALARKAGGHLVTDAVHARAQVKAGTMTAFIAYPAHPDRQPTRVYAADRGLVGNGRYSSTADSLLSASASIKIGSPTLVGIAAGNITTTTTTYDSHGQQAPGLAAVIPPLLYLVVFYLLILLLGNQMLNSLLEEKENRVTEMVLTTIKPTDLIIGKVVSLFTVGLVQILVFAIPTAIGYLFFRTSLNIPDLGLTGLVLDPERMIAGLLILLGGFSLFTATLVALGAAMPTAKDAGPIYGAMMLLIFIPFYIVTLIVTDPGATIVQVFTYLPYSAPITALLRNGFGNLPLWQAAIVIVELFVLTALVLRLAARIFQTGSIAYTDRVNLRSALTRHPAASTASGNASPS
jgi:ABC-2 type transport system permease protein